MKPQTCPDTELSPVWSFAAPFPNEQMPGWYERANISLNASLLDNAPLFIFEAMACGEPF
jgi:glycosyltransferase involved in cell wall biosynthesis